MGQGGGGARGDRRRVPGSAHPVLGRDVPRNWPVLHGTSGGSGELLPVLIPVKQSLLQSPGTPATLCRPGQRVL